MDAGALTEQTLLKHTIKPSETLGTSITVANAPLDWPGNFKLLGEKDVFGRIRTTALAQHEWAPVLMIGSKQIVQKSVTDAGEVNDKPILDPTARISKTTNTATSDINDMLGTGNTASQPKLRHPYCQPSGWNTKFEFPINLRKSSVGRFLICSAPQRAPNPLESNS